MIIGNSLSATLTAVSQPELCSMLQDLGFRAKNLSVSLIDSASDGMVWHVDLIPVPSATPIRFSAELAVAADLIDSLNHSNCGRSLVVAACKSGFSSIKETQRYSYSVCNEHAIISVFGSG